MNKLFKKSLSLFIYIIIFQNIYAQNLEVTTSETLFDKNTYPCIEVKLEPNPDDVKDAWEDFIKDNYDVKMKGNGLFTDKDVLRAEQTNFGTISNKQMDFYTRIVKEGDYTKMYVFASLGYDIPISKKEYPLEFEAMETVTKRFLNNYLPSYYTNWIEETQKKLDDLHDDQNDMAEQIEKNKNEIEKLIKENDELEKSLVTNKTNRSHMSVKLTNKKQSLEKVKEQLKSMNLGDIEK